jgi:hypothetical protein
MVQDGRIAMPYQLACECGKSVQVEETAAGSTTACQCGLLVVIPSLRELRRLSGVSQPGLSPALEIEAQLLAGNLPQETHCVICGVATDACVHCWTECEKAYVEAVRPSPWAYLLAFATFGLFAAAAVAVARTKPSEAKVWGEDRTFSLPLRVCGKCSPGLVDPQKMRGALCRVPLYRRLLEKFPLAKTSMMPPKS